MSLLHSPSVRFSTVTSAEMPAVHCPEPARLTDISATASAAVSIAQGVTVPLEPPSDSHPTSAKPTTLATPTKQGQQRLTMDAWYVVRQRSLTAALRYLSFRSKRQETPNQMATAASQTAAVPKVLPLDEAL